MVWTVACESTTMAHLFFGFRSTNMEEKQDVSGRCHVAYSDSNILIFRHTNRLLAIISNRTSIDPSNKQHHLSVFRGSLVARYGLKDPETLMSKEKVKTEDAKVRVRSIVDEMVKTLDDIDRQLQSIP